MKKISTFKLLLSITLIIMIIFARVPLYAASITDARHKQTIEQFLSGIRTMQNQVADIALSALKSPDSEKRQLRTRINLINNNIEKLNKRIQDYLATVPDVSDRNKHVLLTFNILNFVKSSLYTLNLLIDTNTDSDRFALLDEYFRSRIAALDTFQTLENLLAKFNG